MTAHAYQSQFLFALSALLAITIAIYVLYYRFLHPLSKYPGPFWASITNVYKAYQISTLNLPDKLVSLHEQYGDVVRVGPNDLSIRSPSAYNQIYKGGRSLPKTKFYDAFTAFNPNLFGTQDENSHAIRRRQMAHAFSHQSIREMEPFIDEHIRVLRTNLDEAAGTGAVVDLKELIAYYVLDVLGDLAFSQSFEAQKHRDHEKLPPINDHIYLASLLGQMPEALPYLKKICANLPFRWCQRLFEARKRLVEFTSDCVERRMREKTVDRKDLLGSLLKAVDPDTGATLTPVEIKTEAFAMVVAGSHTTSGTLTLLFAHLLKTRSILERVVSELDSNLPSTDECAYPSDGLEQSLPYTMACINENFRINPVFTMPLTRKVAIDGGMVIDNYHIPQGTTVFCSNHVIHHSRAIWGPTHDVFEPARFLTSDTVYYKRNLFPFSTGHRMCIGKNMAMMNILKVVTTILKFYELDWVDPDLQVNTVSVGISEKEGPLRVRVRVR